MIVRPRPAAPWTMLVTDRRRLCAALGRHLDDGHALLVEQAAAAAAAGVGWLQLREPDVPAQQLFRLAEAIVAVAGRDLRVLVNDRADVAAALPVGVHLRESSAPADRLREHFAALRWVTRSVHDAAGVIGVGPVDAIVAGTAFATASKDDGHSLLGPEGLRGLVAASRVPVLAIGGVTASHWPALAAAGVRGVAAIGAFLPQPGETISTAVVRAQRAFDDAV